MKRAYITMLLLFTALTTWSQEQEDDTLYFSLSMSLEFAMENNLNAENSRLEVDIADQRVWETAALGLPQVDASVNYNYNINLATTLIPDFLGDPNEKIEIQFGTKHNATAGFVGNQLIFSGQYIVGLQTAKIFKNFADSNRKRTEQQVRQTVTENYYLVLLGENTLEALVGNLDNVKLTYKETYLLYQAGFLEEIDADQLAVTMTDLENSVLSMERQVVASRNLLKYQMGLERTKNIILTDSLNELVTRIDYEAALQADLVLEENLDYKILSEQEQLAYMDMKLKRTEYMPSLSAFYSMDFSAQRDEFNFLSSDQNWYKASLLGLSFNVPIFSGGSRKAGVSQKRIAYEQAQNSKDFAEEGIQVEFIQAKYDFANALEKYRSVQKNLELARKITRVTKKKYDEGLVSSLELTQVNDQFLSILSSYTSTMVEVLNAKIRIDVLMNKI